MFCAMHVATCSWPILREVMLAEPEDKAKTRIFFVPHRKVGAPHIIVEIAVHALEQIRLLICEIQQRRFSWRNQWRIERCYDEFPIASFVDKVLVDRMQGAISQRNDL